MRFKTNAFGAVAMNSISTGMVPYSFGTFAQLKQKWAEPSWHYKCQGEKSP